MTFLLRHFFLGNFVTFLLTWLFFLWLYFLHSLYFNLLCGLIYVTPRLAKLRNTCQLRSLSQEKRVRTRRNATVFQSLEGDEKPKYLRASGVCARYTESTAAGKKTVLSKRTCTCRNSEQRQEFMKNQRCVVNSLKDAIYNPWQQKAISVMFET